MLHVKHDPGLMEEAGLGQLKAMEGILSLLGGRQRLAGGCWWRSGEATEVQMGLTDQQRIKVSEHAIHH